MCTNTNMKQHSECTFKRTTPADAFHQIVLHGISKTQLPDKQDLLALRWGQTHLHRNAAYLNIYIYIYTLLTVSGGADIILTRFLSALFALGSGLCCPVPLRFRDLIARIAEQSRCSCCSLQSKPLAAKGRLGRPSGQIKAIELFNEWMHACSNQLWGVGVSFVQRLSSKRRVLFGKPWATSFSVFLTWRINSRCLSAVSAATSETEGTMSKPQLVVSVDSTFPTFCCLCTLPQALSAKIAATAPS